MQTSIVSQLANKIFSSSKFSILSEEKIKKYLYAFLKAYMTFKDIAKEDANIEVSLNPNKLINIFQDYEKVASCVKQQMLKLKDGENIDSHKIASIFLVSILKHEQIIIVKYQTQTHSRTIESSLIKSKSTYELLPYIYFAFILGVVIMEGMANDVTGQNQQIIYQVDKLYGSEFAKMIYANRNAIILPAKEPFCTESAKGVFCLSHIFYFVEKFANKRLV